jgi:DNA (cytosine-5)-methyltransferase 1
MAIPVVDLFAGPGGLNEGFSSFCLKTGEPRFQTIASFEMDQSACNTLAVRSTYRRLLSEGRGLETYRQLHRGEITLETAQRDAQFEAALSASRDEIYCLKLGPETRRRSNLLIRTALKASKVKKDAIWALIGGPPCQAYSLAGRSRRRNDGSFSDDEKHFLYREYLNILSEFSPPIFVMENVKGLLSSNHSGESMFQRIVTDLSKPSRSVRYTIHSLTVAGNSDNLQPHDFVIRSENYGVPQRRHRVILLGIRSDLNLGDLPTLNQSPNFTVRDAIGDLPALRSGLSRSPDNLENWLKVRDSASALFPRIGSRWQRKRLGRGSAWQAYAPSTQDSVLSSWLRDIRIEGLSQHETRSHMESDLLRYWFAATYSASRGVSPTLKSFPASLLPNHANATSTNRPFEDRFRVQVWDRPSTTIVSHIAKDGHYYIHPDPDQMRSFTVREAARLQTFPDSYLFLGNRTSQFHQIGNAVPPLLAFQIAEIVSEIAGKI